MGAIYLVCRLPRTVIPKQAAMAPWSALRAFQTFHGVPCSVSVVKSVYVIHGIDPEVSARNP